MRVRGRYSFLLPVYLDVSTGMGESRAALCESWTLYQQNTEGIPILRFQTDSLRFVRLDGVVILHYLLEYIGMKTPRRFV